MTTLQHVRIQRNPCIRQFKLSVHLSTGGTCAFFSNVWRAVHGSPCFPRHLRILDSHHLRTSLLIPRPPAMFLLLPWRSCAANVLVSPILPWGTGCAIVMCDSWKGAGPVSPRKIMLTPSAHAGYETPPTSVVAPTNTSNPASVLMVDPCPSLEHPAAITGV